jgi:hypothetical protein
VRLLTGGTDAGCILNSIYEFLYVVHRGFDAADKNQDGVIDTQELTALVGK